MNTLLFLLGALGLPQGAGAPVEASALLAEARPVSLLELRAQPGAYLGEEVRFVLQFRALVQDWNPFLSRFESSRWLALEAWPDEVLTWNASEFERPFARLFVRRGGGFEPLARRARAYQRFEVHARVREAFLGEPWIELLTLVPLEGEVGEGTILHVTRARELAAEKQFDLALEQYERARSAPLPPHALAVLLGEIAALERVRELARLNGLGQGSPAAGGKSKQ